MDFELTEEQTALRMMARDVFAKVASPSRLRELWEGAERDPAAWRTMADVGLVGLAVPEAQGGSGGDLVDVALLMEEAGRACVPEPLADTAAIAVPVLLAAGEDPVAAHWLPRIAAGEAVVSVLPADQPYAAHADIADLLLVEVDAFVHAVESDGFRAVAVASEDPTRRLFRVEYETGRRLGPAAALHRLGALATAAALNGIAGALLDMTLEYVKVRRQFGVPVGSFQAVKHKLAGVHAALESSLAATRYAAYAVASSLDDQALAVHVAKAHANEAEQLANTEALQCFAGIGFTWEHDLHLWLKRGRALEQAYGSTAGHRAAIAAALLDGAHDEGGAHDSA